MNPKGNSPAPGSAGGLRLVSVIVPCYNQAEFLEECLESIRAQTYLNWECIILDDGSTDGSADIANTFCRNDSRFSYHAQTNQGASAARNAAIRFSKGPYILPLDGDDKIGPLYIEEAVNALTNNPRAKIVYCKAMIFGLKSAPWKLPEFSLPVLLRENVIFCSGLFRRTDYMKTSGYNTNMNHGLEDWDFWLSMLEAGGEVVRLPGVHFYYRIRANSRNFSMDDGNYRQMLRQIYKNHQSLFDRYQIDPEKEWEKKKKGTFLMRTKSALAKSYRLVFKDRKKD